MVVYDEMETIEKIRVYDKGVDVKGKDSMYKTLIQYRTGDVYVPQFDTSEPLANVANEFVSSIKEKRNALTDGTAGLNVVKILEAAQVSIENNGVTVALDGKK